MSYESLKQSVEKEIALFAEYNPQSWEEYFRRREAVNKSKVEFVAQEGNYVVAHDVERKVYVSRKITLPSLYNLFKALYFVEKRAEYGTAPTDAESTAFATIVLKVIDPSIEKDLEYIKKMSTC
jgi:hypothetical protein